MPDNHTRRPQRPPPRSASRRKRERRRELARTQAQPGRGISRRAILGGSAAAAVAVVLLLTLLLTRGGGAQPGRQPSKTPAPTPTPPTLASLATAATGLPVDGIQCASSEVLTHRITAHLAVFVNGSARLVPAGVGIASPSAPINTNAGPFVESGKCYYAVLTHSSDGIIQAEPAAAQTAYTLGEFFDIWGQPLTSNQVGPATGAVTVYVNGTGYTGDPRAVPITAHALIQLDVGVAQPPQPFTFPPGD